MVGIPQRTLLILALAVVGCQGSIEDTFPIRVYGHETTTHLLQPVYCIEMESHRVRFITPDNSLVMFCPNCKCDPITKELVVKALASPTGVPTLPAKPWSAPTLPANKTGAAPQ